MSFGTTLKLILVSWLVVPAVLNAGELCANVPMQESNSLYFIVDNTSEEGFLKASLKFHNSKKKFIELSADSYGVYVENKSGEMGLPVTLVMAEWKVFQEYEESLKSRFTKVCSSLSVFPGEKVLWFKWDESFYAADNAAVRGELRAFTLKNY